MHTCIYIYIYIYVYVYICHLWAGRHFRKSACYQIYYIKQRQSWLLSNMYLYICSLQYIYMHTYIRISLSTRICIQIYIHIFVHIYINIFMYTPAHLYIYIYVRIYIHISMYIPANLCIAIHIHAHIQIHIAIDTNISTHTYIYTRIYIHTYAYTQTYSICTYLRIRALQCDHIPHFYLQQLPQIFVFMLQHRDSIFGLALNAAGCSRSILGFDAHHLQKKYFRTTHHLAQARVCLFWDLISHTLLWSCNTLHHSATRLNTRQHTATHGNNTLSFDALHNLFWDCNTVLQS